MGRISTSSSQRRRLPWLMLASEGEAAVNQGQRRFHSLESGTTRWIPVPDSVDSVENQCFSSKGWLLIVSRKLSMSLINPFSSVQIPLPDGGDGSLEDFHSFFDRPPPNKIAFVDKFALSTSSLMEDGTNNASYCVAIVYGSCGKLAIWRSGDDKWTRIHVGVSDCGGVEDDDDRPLRAVGDIIFYRGEYYVLCNSGDIFACGFDYIDQRDVVRARFVADISKFELFLEVVMKIYLVESDGKLLTLFRDSEEDEEDDDNPYCITYLFEVLQLNKDDDGGFEVVKVENLGDRALFLGDNESFSIDASENSICKANCMYFTDDWPLNMGKAKDMRIYNLEDNTIEPYCHSNDSFKSFVNPIWIEPSS